MMETKALVASSRLEGMSVGEVVTQVTMIQNLMHQLMKEGEHYGVIPGTGTKPTLLKSGAEKIGFMFRLVPKYVVTKEEHSNNHVSYEVKCQLFNVETQALWGEGEASCSTLESKYRYRPGPVEDTGMAVPREYWNIRNTDPKRAQDLLGGPGLSTKKVDGVWKIVRKGETVENPNPADQWNTVKKMACKRAYVAAILSATAASDFFTQDLEEIVQNQKAQEGEIIDAEVMTTAPQKEQPLSPPAPSQEAPQPQGQQASGGDTPITEPMAKRLYAIAKKAGNSDEEIKDTITRITGQGSTRAITRKHYNQIVDILEKKSPAGQGVPEEDIPF
jgi:hypothetical protein